MTIWSERRDYRDGDPALLLEGGIERIEWEAGEGLDSDSDEPGGDRGGSGGNAA